MAIDHEQHKIRVKALSDRIGHPMTYNDAGAPKVEMSRVGMDKAVRGGDQEREPGRPSARYDLRKRHG